MTQRRATDVLLDHLDLEGARVIDVGSGEGALVRWLRGQGADAVGVECGEVMRARALAADPDHPEAHVDGVGQDLPFEDETADVVVFSYSLHHVPGDEMRTALAEAHRVLKPGGRLFVLEPVASGPNFEVNRLVDDETEVRALAQAALDDAPAIGFEVLVSDGFDSRTVYPDFAAWEHRMVGIDPSRADAVADHRDELERRFAHFGTAVDDGMAFTQPNIFRVLRRPT